MGNEPNSQFSQKKDPRASVTWAILFFGLTRKRIGKKGWHCAFAGLAMGFCVIVAAQSNFEKNDERLLATELQRILTYVSNPAAREVLDTNPVSKGDLGEVERFVKTFANRTISLYNDYEHEIDACGWNNILASGRLKRDPTLVESKAMIEAARTIVDKYRSKIHTLYDGIPNDIRNLNVSEATRKEFQDELGKAILKGRAMADALWGLEASIISEYANIVVLLDAKKSAWSVQDGKVLFANDADLNTWNSHISSIRDLDNKEKALAKGALIETQQKLKNLN
jgi:hypothetical protein